MHIVPAPAESLMKSRVLSIPGLQGVMDKGSAAFQRIRLSGSGGFLHFLRLVFNPRKLIMVEHRENAV